MGDVLEGLYGGGQSGSIGAGRGNIKQKNTYLGENEYTRPLEDIMGLMAQQANQQRAQQNLLFGGAGYGGSFESNDQRAARAAGTPMSQKKYGGWGGFGSQNPTLGGKETTGYVPPGGTQPPPDSGGLPPVGTEPVGPRDPSGPSPLPPTGTIPPIRGTFEPTPAPVPPRGEGPVGTTPGGGPRGSGSTGTGTPPVRGTFGDDMAGFLEQIRAAIGGQQAPTSTATARTAPPTTTPQLDAFGNNTNDPGTPQRPNPASAAGIKALMDPDFRAQAESAYYAQMQASGLDPTKAPKPWYLDPAAVKVHSDLVDAGMNPNSMGYQAEFKRAVAKGAKPADLVKHYTTLVKTAGGGALDAMHGAGSRLGNNWTPESLADGTATKNTLANIGTGHQWFDPNKGTTGTTNTATATGTPTTPVGGAAQPPTRGTTPSRAVASGGYSVGDPQAQAMTMTVAPQGGALLPDEAEDQNPDPNTGNEYGSPGNEKDESWVRPSQFGPQGFNPTTVLDPATGQPVPMDPADTYHQPGYAGGDAWSTSPLWRPEEPTGGLYGAYTDLASGNLTDYENSTLQGWKDMATKAGRGEDEAYGAYGDMLKGGYSDAEKNAITQQGMNAARAGFETNRDAMLRNQARTGNSAGYAANMAKMARGFSETMGSQARQNEIDFANEAQKRKETGASGMLNVAQLGQSRKTTGLQGQQGAGSYARDLQQKGLQGLHALYTGQDPTKTWSTAAGIGSNPRETYTESGNGSL